LTPKSQKIIEQAREIAKQDATIDLEKRKAEFWRDIAKRKKRAETLKKYNLREEDVPESDSDDDFTA
jgi:hypothetical protein